MPDEYQCYKNTKEDFNELAVMLKTYGTIAFPYSSDNFTCLIITMSVNFKKLGVMPWGGNPMGRVYVGVQKRGCGHLPMDIIHESDCKDLCLEGEDADMFTEMYNGIMKAIL